MLLDANVLLPPRLSDVLFDLCLTGLYSARWTADIEAEFLRHWAAVVTRHGKKSLPASRAPAADLAKAARRLASYRAAVASYDLLGHDDPAALASVPRSVHRHDRHVAAAALVLVDYARQSNAADTVYIVSSNLKHLAIADMARLGVSVLAPGTFIDRLTEADSTRVGLALDRSVTSLKNPPYSHAQLLETLLLHGAKGTVRHFGGLWDVTLPPTLPVR